MSRYIDADEVIARIAGQMSYEIEVETGNETDCIDLAEELLNDLSTIDIVRCKECRYCHRNYVDMTPPYQHDYCYKFSRYMNADDFCSYGERSSE